MRISLLPADLPARLQVLLDAGGSGGGGMTFQIEWVGLPQEVSPTSSDHRCGHTRSNGLDPRYTTPPSTPIYSGRPWRWRPYPRQRRVLQGDPDLTGLAHGRRRNRPPASQRQPPDTSSALEQRIQRVSTDQSFLGPAAADSPPAPQLAPFKLVGLGRGTIGRRSNLVRGSLERPLKMPCRNCVQRQLKVVAHAEGGSSVRAGVGHQTCPGEDRVVEGCDV